jgi:hypothetical protein
MVQNTINVANWYADEVCDTTMMTIAAKAWTKKIKIC